MKLSDYVIKFLEQKNIGTVFFVPGGGCMHLLNSLGQHKNIQAVNLLHEQSVAIAAESYAFSGNRVGAALVTTGPGGTNALTGVLSAYLDSIPCVFISGQVKTSDLRHRFGVRSHGSQEADIVNMVKDITKYAVMVTEKDSIRYHLEKAWHEATHGRKGPVWLDIPLDIQASDIHIERLSGYTPALETGCDLKVAAEKIMDMINDSKRPLIIAGNGLRDCEQQFKSLIEQLGIPVIPTWKAVDMIHYSHPLYVGKCGTLGERTANFAMQTADLIISIGSRLDFSITGFNRGKWAVNAKKVVVDIDEAELYKLQVFIDLPVCADAKDVLSAMEEQLLKQNLRSYSFEKWKTRIQKWKETYSIRKPKNAKGVIDNEKISTYDLVEEISAQSDENAVIVPASAGTVAEICYQAIKVKEGQAVRSNHGLGAMGYELPSAVGAYYGTGRTVITIAGDGGIQLNLQELAIITGRNLPIKIFVIDNEGYSSIRNMQRNYFGGFYVGSSEETGLTLPDIHKVAKAYGIPSNSAVRPKELFGAVKEALSSEGPFVCNVKVDPYCIVSPRTSSKVQEDGSMVSTSLEDLFPFLPAQELKKALEIE